MTPVTCRGGVTWRAPRLGDQNRWTHLSRRAGRPHLFPDHDTAAIRATRRRSAQPTTDGVLTGGDAKRLEIRSSRMVAKHRRALSLDAAARIGVSADG